MKCLLGLLALMCFGAGAAMGQSGAPFPREAWDAAAVSVARVGVAQAEGLAALRINPAALETRLAFRGTFAAGSRYAPDDQSATVSAAIGWLGFALDVRRRTWGELATDLGITGLTADEVGIAGSVAIELPRDLSIGLLYEQLQASYLDNRYSGHALDVGVRWTPSLVSSGVVVRNLGSFAEHELEPALAVGIGRELSVGRLRVDLALDHTIVSSRDRRWGSAASLTWNPLQILNASLRGGCVLSASGDERHLCGFGAGISLSAFTMEYGLIPSELLPRQYTISVGLNM